MTAINYDKFFEEIDRNLSHVNSVRRELALVQLLAITADPAMHELHDDAAATLADYVLKLAVPSRGRDFDDAEPIIRVIRANAYQPSMWRTFGGERLATALDQYASAAADHRAVAGEYRRASDWFYAQVGE